MWNHVEAKHPGKLVSKSTTVRRGDWSAEGKGEVGKLGFFHSPVDICASA